MYENLISYLILVLVLAIPLIVTAIGGLFTERSGVTNIALEGIMIIGAFTSLVVINRVSASSVGGPFILYLIGMLVAMVAGILISFIHSIASIKMKANQIISATAINTLTPSLAMFLTLSLTLGIAEGDDKLPVPGGQFKISEVPLLSDIPFIGDLFFSQFYPALYIGILIIVLAYVILYKTKFGLHLRACGENPHAADAAGINIFRIRYIGVSISGALAGLSGFFYVTSFTTVFNNTSVSGFGFLAIAVLIFGNWKPFKIMLAALLFASLVTLAEGIAYFPTLESLGINKHLLSMLPYIVTIIVLILTSKNSRAPKALGQVYDQGQR